MRRGLGYGDALRVLGGDPPAIAALDRALPGLLSGVTGGASGLLLSLFDAQGRLLGRGRDLATGLRERLGGAGRVERTRRLEAAHAVLVVTAYFTALGEVRLPFDVRRLELDGDDQARLALGAQRAARELTEMVARQAPPRPGPQLPYERFLKELEVWYRLLSTRVTDFARGLALWDELDHTGRSETPRILGRAVVRAALDHYQELYARLCGDVPEFALWMGQAEHQATREEVRRALTGVERLLASLSTAASPASVARDLSAAYRAALHRPILTEGETPAGMRLPTLEDGYLDPDFRIRQAAGQGHPGDEGWWSGAAVRSDLTDCLAGLLTSPGATAAPLVVLGQPGAGKSVLTKVLAARLPREEFLPVRVVLREVPAEAEIQDQIEYAVRAATGERTSWPELARAAGGALPVVLLDGFDELLQATGVSQSDYLERVARFQQREADLGRPVAAVVTSRTAVADRARYPEGAVTLRLEPFRREQVESWVGVWNRYNEGYFVERALRPLAVETALRQRVLSCQPLLLLMLALYDADANALQRMGDSLDETALYEELLASFARREVGKSGGALPGPALDRLVEQELQRLSLVAFGMLNRRRQWITGEELEQDLTALLGQPAVATDTFRAPLTRADAALGRFFFVQRAQALREGDRLRTYEFLHATFGEYLVARLTVTLACGLLDQRPALAVGPAPLDDDLLYALLSYAPLSSHQLLRFVRGTCGHRLAPGERERLAGLLVRILADSAHRTGDPHPGYRPARTAVASRHGVYSANLVLLTLALGGETLGRTLFPDSGDPPETWHRTALLWRSSLTEEDWAGLALALEMTPVWDGSRRDVRVGLTDGPGGTPAPVDPRWHYEGGRAGSFSMRRSYTGEVWHKAAVSGGTSDSMLLHALEPVFRRIPSALFTAQGPEGAPAHSVAHVLLSMWLASALDAPLDELAAAYMRCLPVLREPDHDTRIAAARLLLSQMRLDAPRLPPDVVETLVGESPGEVGDLHAFESLLSLEQERDDGLASYLCETLCTDGDPASVLAAWLAVHAAGALHLGFFPQTPAEFFASLDIAAVEATHPHLLRHARRVLTDHYPDIHL
ncbi:hypothetical protein GCM10027168_66960 [Streptomyces capparidis]